MAKKLNEKNWGRLPELSFNTSPLNLNGIIDDISKCEKSKDFFRQACYVSSFFEKAKIKDIDEIIKDKLYIRIIDVCFSNPFFIKDLVDNFLDENLNTNPDKRSLIQICMYLAYLPSVFLIEHLSLDDLFEIRAITLTKLQELISNIDNRKIEDLCFFLEETVFNAKYSNYKDKYPIRIDADFLYKNLKLARPFSGLLFLGISLRFTLKNKLFILEKKEFDVLRVLQIIDRALHKWAINTKEYISVFEGNINFRKYIENIVDTNEQNTYFFIAQIVDGFGLGKDTFTQLILQKIKNINSITTVIHEYALNRLSAFNLDNENKREWSNKIYIQSTKLLSILNILNSSENENWKVKVAIRELYLWIGSIHDIVNREDLVDDWLEIIKYINQEDENIEWKSSFKTPLQSGGSNDIESLKKIVLSSLARTIVGMLNTDGGIIIVGFVEKPELVDLNKNALYTRQGKTFFDLNYEGRNGSLDLDSMIRLINKEIGRSIGDTTEELNNLLSFNPLVLKFSRKEILLVKIVVNKSNKLFFYPEKDGDVVKLKLVKRAKGETIFVDPRKYISN